MATVDPQKQAAILAQIAKAAKELEALKQAATDAGVSADMQASRDAGRKHMDEMADGTGLTVSLKDTVEKALRTFAHKANPTNVRNSSLVTSLTSPGYGQPGGSGNIKQFIVDGPKGSGLAYRIKVEWFDKDGV